MQQFKQSDTAAILIFTLTENVTIADPYYLFVFKHITTKAEIKFIKYITQDESLTPIRYNQFTINPSVIFFNMAIGQWNYKVYQQVSSTNTDATLSGSILEYGKMKLDRAVAFTFNAYKQAQTINAYNG